MVKVERLREARRYDLDLTVICKGFAMRAPREAN
jgi:hypothetical protein